MSPEGEEQDSAFPRVESTLLPRLAHAYGAELWRGADVPEEPDARGSAAAHSERSVSLAGLSDSMGRHAVAEALFREELEGYRRLFGERHPDALAALGALGGNLAAQGRQAEAEPLLVEALDGLRCAQPADAMQLRQALVRSTDFYEGQGRYAEAASLSRELLERTPSGDPFLDEFRARDERIRALERNP